MQHHAGKQGTALAQHHAGKQGTALAMHHAGKQGPWHSIMQVSKDPGAASCR